MNKRLQNLRDDYGDELVDGLLGEFEQMTQQTAEQTQRDSFATKKALIADQLSRESIDFDQVNNDPVFHEYLAKFDPATGVQHQQKLNDAFNSGDFNTVKAMFREHVNGGDYHQPQGSNASMAAGFGSGNGAEKVINSNGQLQQKGAGADFRSKHSELIRRKSSAMSRGDMKAVSNYQDKIDALTAQAMGNDNV